MFVSPVTHKQPAPDPMFLESKDHNKKTTERDTLYVSCTPSISCSHGEKTKYGLLVRMVCEAVSGYICNMEIYAAEGKKLQDTVLSLLDRNLDHNHHLYQDKVS